MTRTLIPASLNPRQFGLSILYELPRLRETGEAYSLLMSKPSGRIAVNEYGYVSYRVLENQSSAQVIEVEEGDDDGAVWSRYRATPLTSEAGALAPIPAGHSSWNIARRRNGISVG